MNFSVTEIEGYKRCKRLSNLTSFNAQGLAKLIGPIYFSTGTIWHDGHHRWLNESHKHFVQCMLEAAKAEVDAVEQRYFDRLGFKPSKEEMQSVWDSINVLPEMANNYQLVWKTPLPEEYECVAPEQTIVVPVPGTEHNLELTIDALIRNVETGDLLIMERKTYSARPNERALKNNNQFLRYIWGARQAGLGDVRGIAYDGAWKRKAPTKKDMTLDDMFLRTTLLRKRFEVENETESIRADVEEMANDDYWLSCNIESAIRQNSLQYAMHPSYFVPWNGCGDCAHRDLCETYRRGDDWQSIVDTQYGRRPRMGHALLMEQED